MNVLAKFWEILKGIFKTLRLALPKLGVGWMFALLTINLNRIAIVELNITAVAITTMLALHYFLSPFQVISGRIADRHPILGFRRSPYLLFSAVLSSSIFLLIPTMALRMSEGSGLAFIAGFGIFIVYGIGIAIMGDSHHSLIAEVTSPRTRGAVISVVWTFSILSTILAAVVMNTMMPTYSHEAMQRLYGITPFIVIGFTLLGVIGMEKRLNKEQIAQAIIKANSVAPPGNPITTAITVLRENPQARGFFAFVFVSIFSIFLQDNILEVFGAEVFGMELTETTRFQPTWGGGVLIGMVLMGILSAVFAISKRSIVMLGCIGTAAGMLVLAFSALTQQVYLVTPSLIFMGLFTGFFNVGALSMMMDMTIEGATGLYMGLWGMAQAFGNGLSSFSSGALHSMLIETGLLTPSIAYFSIFTLEGIGMTAAAIIIYRISVKQFHDQHAGTVSHSDALLAMEAGAAT